MVSLVCTLTVFMVFYVRCVTYFTVLYDNQIWLDIFLAMLPTVPWGSTHLLSGACYQNSIMHRIWISHIARLYLSPHSTQTFSILLPWRSNHNCFFVAVLKWFPLCQQTNENDLDAEDISIKYSICMGQFARVEYFQLHLSAPNDGMCTAASAGCHDIILSGYPVPLQLVWIMGCYDYSSASLLIHMTLLPIIICHCASFLPSTIIKTHSEYITWLRKWPEKKAPLSACIMF